MLDRASADVGCFQMAATAWHDLSHIERRLIGFYRQLSKQEQDQLQRLAEVLVSNPEHTSID